MSKEGPNKQIRPEWVPEAYIDSKLSLSVQKAKPTFGKFAFQKKYGNRRSRIAGQSQLKRVK